MPINYATKTGSDVAAFVRRQFGDESGTQIKSADIIRWINNGQLKMADSGDIGKSIATTPSVAAQTAYTFPANQIIKVLSVWYDERPLESTTFEQAQKSFLNYANVDTGTLPTVWYEYGDSLYLYPAPQENGKSIKLFHVRNPTSLMTLSDALSIPDSYYETLLQYVMKQAHELDEDYTAAQIKGSEFQASMGEVQQIATEDVYPTITVLEEDAW